MIQVTLSCSHVLPGHDSLSGPDTADGCWLNYQQLMAVAIWNSDDYDDGVCCVLCMC